MFISEFVLPTDHPNYEFNFYTERTTAASWLTSALRITRRWPRIYTLGWSVPVDTHRNPQGLLDFGGNPKPAYEAFKSG